MNDMTPVQMKTGIYSGISNEAYHAGPGVSKSGLWTVYTKTPAHHRFAKRKEKAHFDKGTAAHLAILEPEDFEERVIRGPNDRRGNKWKDAQAEAIHSKRLLLTAEDYDDVLAIRDAVHANSFINSVMTSGDGVNEQTAYWTDPETGLLCRCRPDRFRRDMGIIFDVKTGRDASARGFASAVANYGYHAQEAFYTDGWNAATGEHAVRGFAFLVYEPVAPYACGLYELTPSAVEEGRAAMRAALQAYADCSRSGLWPAYGEGIQELRIPRWAYKLTPPPDGLEDEPYPGAVQEEAAAE